MGGGCAVRIMQLNDDGVQLRQLFGFKKSLLATINIAAKSHLIPQSGVSSSG